MWTWLSKLMWALHDVIRSAFAGLWVSLPPATSVPHQIASDPNRVPTGPNLVKNGSFELGNFGAGTTTIVTSGGVIQSWLVLQNGGQTRWIDASHPIFRNAAEGTRLVDLTGGTLPGPGRVLATLYQDAPLGLQSGQSYEVAVELGVGPNNGAGANFGPPVSVTVGVIRPPVQIKQQFVSNPLNPPVDAGITWERFAFRFAIPAGYIVAPANQTLTIVGIAGYQFLGIDNVSVRVLT